MLIEFRVKNFRSFKEEQKLSLVASSDKTHEGNLIDAGKLKLLKATAIFGANASGKSNLIGAMEAMAWFVRNSATKMNQGDSIPSIAPFRLASETRTEPSSFEVVVVLDGVRYEYGFSATAERVYDEWLDVSPKGKAKSRPWIRREFDLETEQPRYDLKWDLKGDKRMLQDKTRDNGLVLSRGAELNVKPLSALYQWFSQRVWVLDLSDQTTGLVQATAQHMVDDDKLRDRVTQLIRHSDVGIVDLKLVKKPFRLDDVPAAVLEGIPEEVKRKIREDGLSLIDIRSMHSASGPKPMVEFDFEDESNGTQRLFALAGPLLDALQEGAVVVVDELECSMHPLLTRKLIEIFQNPEVNEKGAQLLFATHDTTLMDQALFRRDQIWITEKDRTGATELFSLYDFETKDRPRNNEAFARRYLAGRYGGVPSFGPALEDAEIK